MVTGCQLPTTERHGEELEDKYENRPTRRDTQNNSITYNLKLFGGLPNFQAKGTKAVPSKANSGAIKRDLLKLHGQVASIWEMKHPTEQEKIGNWLTICTTPLEYVFLISHAT